MGKNFTSAQHSATHGFGERLAQERREKAARERRDIGQKDVAEAVGSTRPTVSRWEAGGSPPGDAMLQKLADYFGVTMGWLRYGQEPRMAPPPEKKYGELVPDPRKKKPAEVKPLKRAGGDGGR